jgi:hypothetical protein
VDFATDPDNAASYLALLRNHCYDVEVQSVANHGYPTPGDAFAARPANIRVTITPWNETLNEVVFNGQSYLAVDKSSVTLYKEAHIDHYEERVQVATDYPGGWTIDLDAVAYPWLDVTPTSYDVIVKVNSGYAIGTGDPDRSAHFFIVAGNLRKRIDVVQVNESKLEIIVVKHDDYAPITELVFAANKGSGIPPDGQVFRVMWLPNSSTVPLDVSEVPGTTPFAYNDLFRDIDPSTIYDNFNDPDLSPVTGILAPTEMWPYQEAVFVVQPTENTGLVARSTRVNFSVTHDGRTIMIPFFLRQDFPTYAFSDGGTILTLFAHFPRGTNLEGLSIANIPELATAATANAVTKLVIKDDPGNPLTAAQLLNIGPKGGWGALLPNLTALSLPDFTGTIPDNCFFDYGDWNGTATWMESFSAPKATTVGTYAFGYCEMLTSVDLPEAATFGEAAFYYCINLTSITLPKAAGTATGMFESCPELLSVTLPEATTIGYATFGACDKLASVTLPKAVTIEDYAFSYTSLVNVTLPAAITIGEEAFSYCASLESVTLLLAEEIGLSAFDGCENLVNVNVPLATTIGWCAFYACKSLESISLPSAITIEDGAFERCLLLESVTLPVAETIGQYAFLGCENLVNLSLPAATMIGNGAFGACTSLASISLPVATTIGDYAFSDSPLGSLSLPAATKIGDGAFASCSNLTIITLPVATTIGGYAFYSCPLSTVTLGAATISLGTYVFDGANTTSATLSLRTDVNPAPTPPGPFPLSGANWCGYTWGTIKAYP